MACPEASGGPAQYNHQSVGNFVHVWFDIVAKISDLF